MIAQPATDARDKALKRWAEERAGLPDLMYLLRHSPAELGPSEATLADAALRKAPAQRAALRRRLLARLAIAPLPKGKKRPADPAGAEPTPAHPYATVFRVAALVPDSGDYQSYGRSIRDGLKAALATATTRPPARPIELEARSTGADDPGRAVAAFDDVAGRAGTVVGELLSVPTLVLATAARYAGLPLVSPSATDEGIGAMGESVFQIGPSGYLRGIRLAQAVFGKEPLKVGVLTAAASERGPFTQGFVAEAERLGSRVVWRGHYASGSLNFHDEVRALMTNQVELLFWDGHPREAEALVRQLARDRMSLKLCGGDGLSPEQHHGDARILLEGVQFAGEEWAAAPELRARLDAAGGAGDPDRQGGLFLRGYLAGRLIEEALASGALVPEEITDYLKTRLASDPYLRSRRFLDLSAEGVTVPVYSVTRGKAVTR